MSEINDGGPAFPVDDPFVLEPGDKEWLKRLASGMSLRDWFAGKAMQGFIAARANAFSGTPDEFDDRIGSWAYETADAMLRAREN
ncbi:hypothetical protein BLA17378_08621 [Burkholderia aenigmatica]|uniref:Uncharacterized protein n=2 Tax=Burkholderia aenigmatica TaxID=2015348 RepID=A0ABY6Y7F7_9BURK|nr:hypothetical protein BLA17378_08621 [Burkholderia aenigmatica]